MYRNKRISKLIGWCVGIAISVTLLLANPVFAADEFPHAPPASTPTTTLTP